ncbi:MAG: anthranilate phosphoribosyltransferase [Planctomycetes bacterium]|nr:anthranilate phosphoribosyltransferase [Planctomycetota bacterium]
MTLLEYLKRLVSRCDLTEDEAADLLRRVMAGEVTPAQIGALLVALRMKGECLAEITGFVIAAREAATRFPIRTFDDCIDTCGTGGDGAGTFNISTAAAFVAAGAGCKVAKHGNRSNLSRSGSADVLEALGVDVHMPPARAAECLERTGIAFLFAPDYHPGARHVAGPRKEIGVRTIFNALGPMVNPANCRRQVMGVYDAALTEPIPRVLGRLGSTHCLVLCSDDGLDEISLSAPTKISELRDGNVRTYWIEPGELGFARSPISAVAGGDPHYNAMLLRDVLSGEKGPPRNIVVLNAAAAIYVAGRAADIREGIERASDAIDTGAAMNALQSLIDASRAP